MVSNRSAVHIMSATASAMGHGPSNLAISPYEGNTKVERLPVIVNDPCGSSKLLGVTMLPAVT